MNNKIIGYILIIVVIITGVFIYIFHSAIHDITYDTITQKPECSENLKIIDTHSDYHLHVTNFLLVMLLLCGIYFAFIENLKINKNIVKNKKENFDEIKKTLTDNEIKIFDILVKNNGVILQSELVKESKLSKVNITRALEKLQNKKIIIKQRFGMTNKIFLERRE